MGIWEASSNPFASGTIFWRLIVGLQLIQSLCWAASPFCYKRSGGEEIGDLPCNPFADVSMCCGKGWACVENGLCRSTTIITTGKSANDVMGSCTDSTWKSEKCLKSCDNGVKVISCDKNLYCCDPCDCGSQTSLFTLQGSRSPFTTIGYFDSSASGASSSSSPTGLRPSTSSTSSSFSAASSSSSSSFPSSSASSNMPPSPSIRPPAGPTNATKVGVGVGIPVGALCLTAVAFMFFWRERHWKKGMQKMQARLIFDSRSAQPDDFSSEGVPQLPELTGLGVLAEVSGIPRNELPT